jgi:hypothetical protein
LVDANRVFDAVLGKRFRSNKSNRGHLRASYRTIEQNARLELKWY